MRGFAQAGASGVTKKHYMRSKHHTGTNMPQTTLASVTEVQGIGVHTGAEVILRLKPAEVNTGIVFVRTDVLGPDNHVPVKPTAVTSATLSTIISNAAGVSVATIEHVMAALSALGVDNAILELDGPEVPIMDGSARDFVAIIDKAGVQRQQATRDVLRILHPIEVDEGDKWARLEPAQTFTVDCAIDFDTPLISRQRIVLAMSDRAFRQELAVARTFGFAKDVEALRAQGLARGGSLDNCIVIENDQVKNPGGLRYADEFVRHKALDAIGDLYVLGMPVLGRFEAYKPGHALNNSLVRAVLQQPQCWDVVSEHELAAARTQA